MSRMIKIATLGAASAAAAAMMAAPAHAAQLASGTVVVKLSNGTTAANCASTLDGTRSGSAINVTGATATSCGVTVTPVGLPWTGNIAAPATMFFSMKALGCTYSGTLSGGTVAAGDVVTWTNQPVTGSGSILCVSGVTVTAVYDFV
ncbi:hypothetical protein EDD29_6597 [Actinocorallia herbida]|uniref:Protein activator of alkane oxidation PraB n=1 Tax=Actinocorallia herbida TaxID=58109 RepID=A0A3N1D5T7_9ACTN|nr:hypothetical protein [Actinocorallia herbida]ROO88912.1 hypothetical protein EDD29_6597 [Actinocorallia herbida]